MLKEFMFQNLVIVFAQSWLFNDENLKVTNEIKKKILYFNKDMKSHLRVRNKLIFLFVIFLSFIWLKPFFRKYLQTFWILKLVTSY